MNVLKVFKDKHDVWQSKRKVKELDKFKHLYYVETLIPGQEEQWLRKIKVIVEELTANLEHPKKVLQSLLPYVQYHADIEKIVKKEIKRLNKKKCPYAAWEILQQLIKDYVVTEKNNNPKIAHAAKTMNEKTLSFIQLADVERQPKKKKYLQSNLDANKKKRKFNEGSVKKRCHLCRKRGHIIKDCPSNIKRKKSMNRVKKDNAGDNQEMA